MGGKAKGCPLRHLASRCRGVCVCGVRHKEMDEVAPALLRFLAHWLTLDPNDDK